MDMMTARQAAEKWNTSVRNVQDLCRRGRVPGAEHWGNAWMIPQDAPRPPDGRSRLARTAAATPQPLLRQSPFMDMTDLYNVPGGADQCAAALAGHPETQALFAAEIAYSRGQIDDVYRHARYFLDNRSSFFSVIAGGMLLGLVAMWKGDIHLWEEAHRHFYDAPCRNAVDRDIVALALASTDSAIRNTADFPRWFATGCFDNLPRDAHPAARVYYIKHLLIFAQELALGNIRLDGVSGLGLMKTMPYILEPMISQMVVEQVVMGEIYLRLLAAIVYHQCGDDTRGGDHLDRAIRLCLADGLYGPICEHRRQLGLFLDDRLARIDPEALKKVKTLHKQLHTGWTRLHNAVMKRTVTEALTVREREVARLAAFGLSNQEIARQLGLSTHTVRTLLNTARDKIGNEKRRDLALYI